ncbi:MAG: hypothetical protein A2252_01185 [Elusimicrobia bacterium RIFOXYA2_FULL_39_19]|nr:MAG: hypothetical protein A2252_01185 [Elusimicrobia bacterium RIFOXYA2_FULL_39_19]
MAHPYCWNCQHYRITRAPHSKTQLIESPEPNYCQNFLQKTGKYSPVNLTEAEKLLIFRKPGDCCDNWAETEYQTLY